MPSLSFFVNKRRAVIRLRAGDLRVDVCPAFGGRILRFMTESSRIDWLKPIGVAAVERGEHVRGGCFPLVPYSNRIRDAQLAWQDRQLRLVPDPLGAPHAMHGHGWRKPWTVLLQDDRSVVMRLLHESDRSWPFDYEATQSVRIHVDRLELSLSLRNIGGMAMPAGIGWHPYFPWHRGAEARFRATRQWPCAGDLLPTMSTAMPAALADGVAPRSARSQIVLAFSGWNGQARIAWPASGHALDLHASRSLAHGIFFMPGDAAFMCLEPASHTVDAFNLASQGVAGTGTRVLAPGEALSGRMALLPTPTQP